MRLSTHDSQYAACDIPDLFVGGKSSTTMKYTAWAIVVLAAFFGGCISHPVKFENASYSVPRSGASGGTSIVAVITPETLAVKKAISSWMTGIAHKWDAEPGLMLK